MSGSYLSENKAGTTPGIPLDMGDSKVIFGYMFHKGEKIDESVQEFLDFLIGQASQKLDADLFQKTRMVF